MKARLIVTAEWTVHEDPDDLHDAADHYLDDIARVFGSVPEALADFLDRDEVQFSVEGEWV